MPDAPEQKRIRRANRTEAQKRAAREYSAHWNRDMKTPEQRKKYCEAQKARWRFLTPDQKRAVSLRQKERDKNLSPEKMAERKAKQRAYWHKLTPEKLERAKEIQRAWLSANPEKARAKVNRRRTRLAGAEGSFTEQEWNELVERFDHRCPRCGKSEPEISLTIDHVIPISQGGSNSIKNIQPLCGPCNSSKSTDIMIYIVGRISGNSDQCSVRF